MVRAGWVAAGVLLWSGTGCLSLGREEATERIREEGPIVRVDIELDGGTVGIVGTASGVGASGVVVSRWADTPPEIVHYVEDGVLHILGRCENYSGPCLLEVELTVPDNANVGIVTGDGDVTVRGIEGDVEIVTGGGAIEAHELGGTFFVETELGDIVADGLGGVLVDARTGGGDVDLRMTAAPQRLVGRTQDGDITLVVPPGSYRVEAEAPKGELDLAASIVDDPAASSVIVAETANGDVTIQGRGQAKPQELGDAPAKPK